MSRYYEMALRVRGANPDRVDAIKDAAAEEWSFDDWHPLGDPHDPASFFSQGRDNLCGCAGESEFAEGLARAIGEANGGYREVEVSATRLHDTPDATYRLGRHDFERTVSGNAHNLREPKRPYKEPEPYPVARRFRCPECGERRLEEVMRDVVYVTEIREVREDGDVEYADTGSADDGGAGELDRYQCRTCGWILPCEADPVALAEYLADPERACNPDPPHPQPENVTTDNPRLMAVFRPQAWRNDQAIDIDHPVRFDATAKILPWRKPTRFSVSPRTLRALSGPQIANTSTGRDFRGRSPWPTTIWSSRRSCRTSRPRKRRG